MDKWKESIKFWNGTYDAPSTITKTIELISGFYRVCIQQYILGFYKVEFFFQLQLLPSRFEEYDFKVAKDHVAQDFANYPQGDKDKAY